VKKSFIFLLFAIFAATAIASEEQFAVNRSIEKRFVAAMEAGTLRNARIERFPDGDAIIRFDFESDHYTVFNRNVIGRLRIDASRSGEKLYRSFYDVGFTGKATGGMQGVQGNVLDNLGIPASLRDSHLYAANWFPDRVVGEEHYLEWQSELDYALRALELTVLPK
jgi:hypothetical protein